MKIPSDDEGLLTVTEENELRQKWGKLPKDTRSSWRNYWLKAQRDLTASIKDAEIEKLKAEHETAELMVEGYTVQRCEAKCQERVERILEKIDQSLSHWDSFSPLCHQQMVAMATSEWLKLRQALKGKELG